MDNQQIYKATLCFSLRRLLWDLLGLIGLSALAFGGLLIAEKLTDKGLVGLLIGGIIGLFALVFFLRWVSYKFKAGQIAMMTKGITEGSLPGDVLGEGMKTVKERFTTVAAFFAATGLIKGIFNQIGRGITAAGRAIGGDSGNNVASAINSVIQVVINYLCDCCLGWVFYRREIKSAKATLEGAVLFFRHGKTLAKNLGRVFGIGLTSFIAIGGVFTGIFYLIASGFPAAFEMLFNELTEAAVRSQSTLPGWLNSPGNLMLIASAVGGMIIWAVIHSVFIRPFVLTGVLRNYINSGIKDIPTEDSFSVLDQKSEKFRKLHAQI